MKKIKHLLFLFMLLLGSSGYLSAQLSPGIDITKVSYTYNPGDDFVSVYMEAVGDASQANTFPSAHGITGTVLNWTRVGTGGDALLLPPSAPTHNVFPYGARIFHRDASTSHLGGGVSGLTETSTSSRELKFTIKIPLANPGVSEAGTYAFQLAWCTQNPSNSGNLDGLRAISDLYYLAISTTTTPLAAKGVANQTICWGTLGFGVDFGSIFALPLTGSDMVNYTVEFVGGDEVVDPTDLTTPSPSTLGATFSWTANVNGASWGTGFYKVTPEVGGASGKPAIFQLSRRQGINLAALEQNGKSITVKNGDQVDMTQFTGLPAGTKVTWTVVGTQPWGSHTSADLDAMGFSGAGASGSEIIPAFIARNNTNTGTSPTNLELAFTLSAEYTDGTPCSTSTTGTYKIIIQPRSDVDYDLRMVDKAAYSQAIAHGATFAAVTFEAKYNNQSLIGDRQFGIEYVSGDPVLNLNGHAQTNASGVWASVVYAAAINSSGTGTYRVTPYYNGKVGVSATFTMTVYPDLSSSAILDGIAQAGHTFTVENGKEVSAMNFTGFPEGTEVHWEVSATNTGTGSTATADLDAMGLRSAGVNAKGVNEIPAFTAVNTDNTGALKLEFTLTLKDLSGAAASATRVYTIMIAPTGNFLYMESIQDVIQPGWGTGVDASNPTKYGMPIKFLANNDDPDFLTSTELVTYIIKHVDGANLLTLSTGIAFTEEPGTQYEYNPADGTNTHNKNVFGIGVYEVTPIWRGVAGQPTTFTYTRYPELELNTQNLTTQYGTALTVSNGDKVDLINFNVPENATLWWGVDSSSEALAKVMFDGKEKGYFPNIPAFTAINEGHTPIVITFQLRLYAGPENNWRSSGTRTFTLTILPTIPADTRFAPIVEQTACPGIPFDNIGVELLSVTNQSFITGLTNEITYRMDYVSGAQLFAVDADTPINTFSGIGTGATASFDFSTAVFNYTYGTGIYKITALYKNKEFTSKEVSLTRHQALRAALTDQEITVTNGQYVEAIELFFDRAPVLGDAILKWSYASTEYVAGGWINTVNVTDATATTTTSADYASVIPAFTAYNPYNTPIKGRIAMWAHQGGDNASNCNKDITYFDIIVMPSAPADTRFVPISDQTACPGVAFESLRLELASISNPGFIDGLTADEIKYRLEYVSGDRVLTTDHETATAAVNTILATGGVGSIASLDFALATDNWSYGTGVYKVTALYDDKEIASEEVSLTRHQGLRPKLYDQTMTVYNGQKVEDILLTFDRTPLGTAELHWSYTSTEKIAGGWANEINVMDPTGGAKGSGTVVEKGTGVIPSFIAYNPLDEPIMAKITLWAHYGNDVKSECGAVVNHVFKIVVLPSMVENMDMTITPVADQTICFDATKVFAPMKFTAAKTNDPSFDMDEVVFLIEFVNGTQILDMAANNSINGVDAAATGWEPTFVSPKVSGTGTYKVTPTWNNMKGQSTTFNLTVLPEIKVTDLDQHGKSYKTKNGHHVPETVFTGLPEGAVVSWELIGNPVPAINMGIGTSGTNRIPAFTAVNPSPNDDITLLFKLTAEINGCTATGAGNYAIVISSKTGLAVNILAKKNPTDCNNNDGSFSVHVTGGSGDYVISVNGEDRTTFNGLAPGTYNLVVTDKVNTELEPVHLEVTLEAFVADPLRVSAKITHPTPGKNDGKVNVFVEGGSGEYEYRFSHLQYPQTSAVPNFKTDLRAGEYNVTVSDKNCSDVEPVIYTFVMEELKQPNLLMDHFSFAPINLGATPTGLDIKAGMTPPLSTFNGGAAEIKYIVEFVSGVEVLNVVGLNDIETTALSAVPLASTNFLPILATPNVSGTGTYRITPIWTATQEYGGGVGVPFTFTYTVNAGLAVHIQEVKPTCGGNNGRVIVSVEGGSGEYQLSMNGDVKIGKPAEQFTGLAAGTYNLVVTDVNNAELEAVHLLVVLEDEAVEPLNVTIKTTNPSGSENNGSVQVIVKGGTGTIKEDYVYRFSHIYYYGQNDRIDRATNLREGNYSVTVYDPNCTAVEPVTVYYAMAAVEQPALFMNRIPAETVCFGATGKMIDFLAHVEDETRPLTGFNEGSKYGVEYRIEYVEGAQVLNLTTNSITAQPTKTAEYPVTLAGVAGTGVYKVTPTWTGRESDNLAGGKGNPILFTYTVTSELLVGNLLQAGKVSVFQNGDRVNDIVFEGLPEGTVITWTADNAANAAAIGTAANGTGMIPAFTATNTTNADITVVYTLTAALNGCSNSDAATYTIVVKPRTNVDYDLVATIITADNPRGSQTVCYGTDFKAIEFGATDRGTAVTATYRVEFVEGDDIFQKNTASGNTWTPWAERPGKGIYRVVPIYNNREGVAFTFTLEARQSLAGLITQGNLTYQNGDNVSAIDLSTNIPAGAVVTWTSNNPATGVAASGSGVIPGFIATNTTGAPISTTIAWTIEYPNKDTNEAITCRDGNTFTITVTPKTNVDYDLIALVADLDNPRGSQTVCYGTDFKPITFGARESNGYRLDNDATYRVEFVEGDDIFQKNTASGNTWTPWAERVGKGTYRVVPIYNNREGVAFTFTLEARQSLAGLITQGNLTFQNGDNVPAIDLSGNVPAGAKVTWTSTGDAIGLPATGSGIVPAFIAINTSNTTNSVATIAWAIEYPNKDTNPAITCRETGVFTITVTPNTIGDKDLLMHPVDPQEICRLDEDGVPAKFTPITFSAYRTDNVTLAGTVEYRVEYVSGDQILDLKTTGYNKASGTTDATWQPNLLPDAIGTGTYRVVPRWNNNEGYAELFTLTVYPVLDHTTINVENMVYVNGTHVPEFKLTALNLPEGASIVWERTSGDVGTLDNGIDYIPAFTAFNNNSDGTNNVASYKVWIEYGLCNDEEKALTFDIIVRPVSVQDPDLGMNAVVDQTVCHDASFGDIPLAAIHKFEELSGGAQYDVAFDVELISGVNVLAPITFPRSVFTNQGDSTITWGISTANKVVGTGTYRITPVWNNRKGMQQMFTLTRLPEAKVDPIANVVLCNNSPLAINFTSAGNETYQWEVVDTNGDPTASVLGIPANGHSGINVSRLVNNGSAVVTETIKVTPLITIEGNLPCEGTPIEFTVSVIPTPLANAMPNIVLQHGDSIYVNDPRVEFTGTATAYKWKSSNPAINADNTAASEGIVFVDAVTGEAFLPEFEAQNANQDPVISEITVTPVYEHKDVTCEGASIKFSIAVVPELALEDFEDMVICEGQKTESVEAIGLPSGRAYFIRWDVTGEDVGLGSDGTTVTAKRIPSFTAPSDLNGVEREATVEVTPYFTSGGNEYAGTTRTFTIRVKANVYLDIDNAKNTVVGISECEDSDPVTMSVVAAGTNLSYQWFKDELIIPGATDDEYTIASLTTSDAGKYHCMVYSDCDEKQSLTYDVNVRVNVLKQDGKDVMVMITNPDNNGGYQFSDIQWYETTSGTKVLLHGENKSYLVVPSGVEGKTYIAEAQTQHGTIYESCPLEGVNKPEMEITLSHNPVDAGSTFRVIFGGSVNKTDLRLHLTDIQGVMLRTVNVQPTETEVSIVAPNVSGIYVLNVIQGGKKEREYKVVVK